MKNRAKMMESKHQDWICPQKTKTKKKDREREDVGLSIRIGSWCSTAIPQLLTHKGGALL